MYKVEYKLKKSKGALIILTPTNAASPDDGAECRRATEEGKDGEVVAPRVAVVTGMGSVTLSSVICHLYHLIIESYCSQAPSEASTAQSY